MIVVNGVATLDFTDDFWKIIKQYLCFSVCASISNSDLFLGK